MRSLTRIGYATILLATVAYAVIAFPQGMHAWNSKQREIQGMEKRNSSLARQNERERGYLERLRTDPSAQELEIRRRLKLLHPNEREYVASPEVPESSPAGNRP
jgi:hypothetical protein